MTTTAINQTTDKTNMWLNEIADHVNWDDSDMCFKALRLVLHQLRDRLPINESAQLASQLPMLVRGAYYENWRPQESVQHVKVETFVSRIAAELPPDFAIDAYEATQAVFAILAKHVSAGEIADVQACLPDEFQQLWPQ